MDGSNILLETLLLRDAGILDRSENQGQNLESTKKGVQQGRPPDESGDSGITQAGLVLSKSGAIGGPRLRPSVWVGGVGGLKGRRRRDGRLETRG